jgi:hypothetical protein
MLKVCMGIDNRQTPRFRDFARAKIEGLCQLPGILADVSRTGCRVRFSHRLEVDVDREYTLTVLPALRSGIREFELIVKPEWVRSSGDSLDIGFSILHSPGIRDFAKYVSILAREEEEELQEA